MSVSIPLVAGRTTLFVQTWRSITQDQWVLNTIQGYRIQFVKKPFQHHTPIPPSMSVQDKLAVDGEVKTLLTKGAIQVVPDQKRVYISNIFIVPKKGGGLRPVINVKGLNGCTAYHHFKMEDLSLLKNTLAQGDWMGKLDLRDAYFTIPIHQDHCKYLQFKWRDTLCQFTCLPFVLSQSPRVFTKVLRPVIAHLRRKGIRMLIYLDDSLIMNRAKKGLSGDIQVVRDLLQSLGFLIRNPNSTPFKR